MKTLIAKAAIAATSLLVLLSLLYLSLASGQSDRALVRQKPSGSSDERRVALVIGNSGYQNTPPLTNPRNDAAAVGESLKRLGFDVDVQLDLTRTAMEEALRHFGDRLEGAKVALFFYAGHGLQVNGANYLVPVDAKLAKERDLSYEAVELAKVLREMEAAQRTNLVILDACRDNPLSRSLARSLSGKSRSMIGQGLAPVDAATGTLIAYATKDGNVAADGAGQHSPYTDALLKHLETPGLEVGLLMRRVREEVVNITGEKQVPWEYGSLIGEFYFKPQAATASAPPATTTTTAPKPEPAPPAATPSSTVDPKAVELSYWDSIKDSNNEALLKSYLERYPKGTFADIARIKLQELAKPKPAPTPAPKPAPPPVATITPPPTPPKPTKPSLAGIWQQQLCDNMACYPAVIWKVSETNGKYAIQAMQVLSPTVVLPSQVKNIHFDGEIWTFNAYFGQMGVASAELHKRTADVFEGYLTLGAVVQANRWLRIQQ